MPDVPRLQVEGRAGDAARAGEPGGRARARLGAPLAGRAGKAAPTRSNSRSCSTRRLVEERLEEVVVATVDKREAQRRACEFAGRV